MSEPDWAALVARSEPSDGSARDVIAVALIGEDMPRTGSAARALADQVLGYLRSQGYAVVSDDLALHAYDAGRADGAQWGAS